MLEPIMVWKQRQNGSARETARYMREAARGGLFTFLMLAFIVGSYGYGKMLMRLSSDYPFWWVAIAVLLPSAGYSHVRTYLREPDIAFLLAAESRMGFYWRQSFMYSWALQSFGAIAIMLALWPLYRHCRPDQADPLWMLWAGLLALKAAALAAGWQESRVIGAMRRFVLGGFRWLMAGLVLYAMLAHSVRSAAFLFVPAILIYALCMTLLHKQGIDWDTLIRVERRMTAARRRVFGWFADVPELQGEVKRRPIWARLTRLIPFRQRETMTLLLSLSFLRSERFGIVQRMTWTALFLEAVLPGRWAFSIVAVLFVAMTALQLAGLARAQELSVWPRLYPIDAEEQQARAQRRLSAVTLIVQSTVFTIWGAYWSRDLKLAGVLWLALLAVSLIAATTQRKKLKR